MECPEKLIATASFMLALCAVRPTAESLAEPGGIAEANKDGSVRIENELVRIRVSNRPGLNYGLTEWFFKPTGYEMIDVLYGQTDHVPGHMLGEAWDPVELGNYGKGQPNVGNLLLPLARGLSKDGSAAMLVQESVGEYRLRRTLVLRRDHSVLEVRYELENLTALPKAFSLRLHCAMSPGARGKYQRRDDLIFMDTESGVCQLDQTLPRDRYNAAYGADRFFLPVWEKEPQRHWVAGKLKTPTLKANWAAQVNSTHGDGMAFSMDMVNLVGFYNCPGITLEPVMKAIALEPGSKWTTHLFLSSFSGAKGAKVVGANALYVELEKLHFTDGKLNGRIIPLCRGKVELLDAGGKSSFTADASPQHPIELKDVQATEDWRLEFFGNSSHRIGTAVSGGKVELTDPQIAFTKTPKPRVWRSVFKSKETSAALARFLDEDDYTIYCDWSSSEEVKAKAKEMALHLGRGLSWTNPLGKMLVIGAPADNSVVSNAGKLRNSFASDWPGKGKGAIAVYENFEETEQPLAVIGGSDDDGVLLALDRFQKEFVSKRKPRKGTLLWASATNAKIQPYSRPPRQLPEKIVLECARGEVESAQAVITAYEGAINFKLSVDPLIGPDGKELGKVHTTHYRRRNGPLWLRWVHYYPVDRKNGWTGYPDPLLEQKITRLDPGQSQPVWLTVFMPERASAGTYRSAFRYRQGDEEQVIPIEVNVWDFVIPREGLIAEPYMHLDYMAPSTDRELRSRHIFSLVTNFVDHGMRIFHISNPRCFHWHYSPEGEYKGKETSWLIVSEDGKVALDVSYFDWVINEIETAARPYKLRYMIYIQALTNLQHIFQRTLPKRFEGRPKRKGHWYQNHYAEEMLRMFKTHSDRKGLTDRLVIKISDEPAGFDHWWDTFTVAAREADIPFITAFNNIDWKQAEKALGSQLKIFQPLYQFYNAEFYKKAKAAGHLVAWYNCGPPPTIHVGSTASEIRGYLWQAAKHDLDIVSWWGIQCWSSLAINLWTNRYSHHHSVVYMAHPHKPPKYVPKRSWIDQAPLDSIRWELIERASRTPAT